MLSSHNFGQGKRASIKSIQIIHLAMLAGQVLFAIVVLTLLQENSKFVVEPGEPYLYMLPAMAAGAVALSGILFRQMLGKAREQPDVPAKLVGYQSALIIKLALLQGTSLFGIVASLITTNLLYLTISTVLMVYFFLQRPAKQKIIDDLELNWQETGELE